MSQRFKLILEYDGRPFLGWQKQSHGLGVQDKVEQALYNLFKKKIDVICAGRTDTGVHGLGQVIHCDINTGMTANKLKEALNYYLKPHPICILEVTEVSDNFHARFDALQRHYRYKILNRRSPPTYQAGLVWHVICPLDRDKMQEAAQYFLGKHDFTTFRATGCQSSSSIRTIDAVSFEAYENEIHFCVKAKSFLQHQVRSMVGCLVKIGIGQKETDWIKTLLEVKNRTECAPVASPYGLYFEKVIYK